MPSSHLEQGIQGQLDKFPNDTLPAGWNNFGDPNTGTGFVNHLHAGLGYLSTAAIGLHYISAWTQDDRASQAIQPDGKINILGSRSPSDDRQHRAPLLRRCAHQADQRAIDRPHRSKCSTPVAGRASMDNYLGPNSGGTGTLTTVGVQYDLSLISVMRYPAIYAGDSPDFVFSVFGMQTHVTSNDPAFDGVTKRKFGAEGAYSILPWLATSLRVDRVMPELDESAQSFSIVSPRLIFRTKWQAHDQVVLQYSHWIERLTASTVRSGYPAVPDPTLHPDEDMISLSASMWW